MTTGSVEGKADSDVKEEEEGETEPLADKEVEVLGRIEETDQPMEYIICFAKAVELYQQKNRSCFRCRSPDHLMWDCTKDLNTKDGMAKKGGWAPQKSAVAQ